MDKDTVLAKETIPATKTKFNGEKVQFISNTLQKEPRAITTYFKREFSLYGNNLYFDELLKMGHKITLFKIISKEESKNLKNLEQNQSSNN